MAPEQYEGRGADARTDLYAFGCALHAPLTGRPPFPGPSMADLLRRTPAPLTMLRQDVPAELEKLATTGRPSRRTVPQAVGGCRLSRVSRAVNWAGVKLR